MPSYNLPVYAAFPSPPKRSARALSPKSMYKPLVLPYESPTRPVLAVIQATSAQTDDDAPLWPAAGPRRPSTRLEVRQGTGRAEERGRGRRSAGGHGRSASDGAVLYLVKPLPALPVPSPPRQPNPPPRPTPTRSRSEPIRPSPLAPRPTPAPPPARRGRSTSIRSPSAPIAPIAPPLAPLSRRYTRSASLSFLSSRSPVQERSIPHFSTVPTSFSAVLAPASAPDSAPRAYSSPDARLVESLVLRTLERRLSERLEKARMGAVGERAGLGGLRSGREMWIWSAVRRCQVREGLDAVTRGAPHRCGSGGRHVRSSSMPVFTSSGSPSADPPSPVSHRSSHATLHYRPTSPPPPHPFDLALEPASHPSFDLSHRTPSLPTYRLPRPPPRAMLRPASPPRAARPAPAAQPLAGARGGDSPHASPFHIAEESPFVARAGAQARLGARLPRAPPRAASVFADGGLGAGGAGGMGREGRCGSGRGIVDWSRSAGTQGTG